MSKSRQATFYSHLYQPVGLAEALLRDEGGLIVPFFNKFIEATWRM
ncbi:hypothetical protein MEA186_06433 [Mesorhizobium amorphae CCNWGS0123]|uniref:Uncharacterized protein n=2 Tax=Mesorhizobium amorphae TaxID=71433 RepID=G6Y5S7_9HYPH|nr:hypothetical protein MEA186_06433 [Mesorhizobium amorphae CCNWGS0123]